VLLLAVGRDEGVMIRVSVVRLATVAVMTVRDEVQVIVEETVLSVGEA
jgi:hypothetical protein